MQCRIDKCRARLALHLVCCRDLAKGDMHSSDPFVRLRLLGKGGEELARWTSSTKRATLQPVFNERFAFEAGVGTTQCRNRTISRLLWGSWCGHTAPLLSHDFRRLGSEMHSTPTSSESRRFGSEILSNFRG